MVFVFSLQPCLPLALGSGAGALLGAFPAVAVKFCVSMELLIHSAGFCTECYAGFGKEKNLPAYSHGT